MPLVSTNSFMNSNFSLSFCKIKVFNMDCVNTRALLQSFTRFNIHAVFSPTLHVAHPLLHFLGPLTLLPPTVPLLPYLI